MPRFVILEHDQPILHWDFMLEVGDVLRTWRLAEPPSPGAAVAAEPSFDHRPFYLDYEGPVSGNRGTVKRWDAGTYRLERETPERMLLWLEGENVSGPVLLERDEATNRWWLQSGNNQSASSNG